MLAEDKRKYNKIVIRISGNKTQLIQSEVTEMNVELVCTDNVGLHTFLRAPDEFDQR